MKILKVLVACEESQAVTKAFRALGHESYSCDIEDCSGGQPEWHIKGDAIKQLYSQNWDLVIAHPPCTRLTNAGVRWLVSEKPRDGYIWNEKYEIYTRIDASIWMGLKNGVEFFNAFKSYGLSGKTIAIENPIPHKYARDGFNLPYLNNQFIPGIGSMAQLIQPYQFGHTEKKGTGFWLYGLPFLKETNNVYHEMMKLPYAERAKIHYASPGKDRAKIRSKTFPGIADAMAKQWSEYLLNPVKTYDLFSTPS